MQSLTHTEQMKDVIRCLLEEIQEQQRQTPRSCSHFQQLFKKQDKANATDSANFRSLFQNHY